MTEAEWHEPDTNAPIFGFVDRCPYIPKGKGRTRKLRLMRCAVLRAAWKQLPDDVLREAIKIAEEFADGVCSQSTVLRVRSDVAHIAHWLKSPYVAACFELLRPAGYRNSNNYFFSYGSENSFWTHLREMFGNPFRPVAFDPDWRTSTAVAIAQGMYESREFSAMPILADALQDAGCDNDEILTHCRDPQQVHVRGCWVVDGVLGKS